MFIVFSPKFALVHLSLRPLGQGHPWGQRDGLPGLGDGLPSRKDLCGVETQTRRRRVDFSVVKNTGGLAARIRPPRTAPRYFSCPPFGKFCTLGSRLRSSVVLLVLDRKDGLPSRKLPGQLGPFGTRQNPCSKRSSTWPLVEALLRNFERPASKGAHQ